MKLIKSEKPRRAWTLTALCVVTACSSGGGGNPPASTTPSPASPVPTGAAQQQTPLGDVERAAFAPGLNIRLDSMVRRPSGLYVRDLTMGTGAVATRGRTVIVRYSGWLANGKLFDSGEISVTLGSNKTIRAWEDGLLGMRVGGKRRLVVPPSLGYGSRGAGADIPPNAVLVFDMEMMSAM